MPNFTKEPEKSWRDYLKVTSLTWWAGLALLALGVLSIEGVSFLGSQSLLGLVKALAGSSDPGFLIATGLAFIGVRAKLGRHY